MGGRCLSASTSTRSNSFPRLDPKNGPALTTLGRSLVRLHRACTILVFCATLVGEVTTMMTTGRLIELALGKERANRVDYAIPQPVMNGMSQKQREDVAGWYYEPEKANVFG